MIFNTINSKICSVFHQFVDHLIQFQIGQHEANISSLDLKFKTIYFTIFSLYESAQLI